MKTINWYLVAVIFGVVILGTIIANHVGAYVQVDDKNNPVPGGERMKFSVFNKKPK